MSPSEMRQSLNPEGLETTVVVTVMYFVYEDRGGKLPFFLFMNIQIKEHKE